MAGLGVLGNFLGFGANMAGLAAKRWETIELNRRFELYTQQVEGAAKAAQAGSGIETIGGASPGAQMFQETMHREFQNQMEMMKRGQQMNEIAGLLGAGTELGGGFAKNAFQTADLYKMGAAYTPNLNVPSTSLIQSDFVKGALSGPRWGP